MRIALIVDWHSEKMGYSDHFLSKTLASLGHEVHLVTSNGQGYFTCAIYKDVFEHFLGQGIVNCGVKFKDGYTLHRLPHALLCGRVRIKGLIKKLRELRPDIVQSGEFDSLVTFEAALAKPILKYKFFVECHTHASVFPATIYHNSIKERVYWPVFSSTIGRLVSLFSEKCYPISIDAADIAVKFLGMHKNKIIVRSLGVDITLFRPVCDEKTKEGRWKMRKNLGISPSDIVCIYTGRLSPEKNPLCLAKAIEKLIKLGYPFRGLFVGYGPKEYIASINSHCGCIIHPFVPVQELPPFYWASDIGVWPKQESTSQLDAVACGLPLILSNRVKVLERIEGNGLLYDEDNADDLTDKLLQLSDVQTRIRMGEYGARKMRERFSWDIIAKEYEKDYEAALRGRN